MKNFTKNNSNVSLKASKEISKMEHARSDYKKDQLLHFGQCKDVSAMSAIGVAV